MGEEREPALYVPRDRHAALHPLFAVYYFEQIREAFALFDKEKKAIEYLTQK